MKKLLALMLAAALALSLMACGGGGGTGDTNTPSTESENTPSTDTPSGGEDSTPTDEQRQEDGQYFQLGDTVSTDIFEFTLDTAVMTIALNNRTAKDGTAGDYFTPKKYDPQQDANNPLVAAKGHTYASFTYTVKNLDRASAKFHSGGSFASVEYNGVTYIAKMNDGMDEGAYYQFQDNDRRMYKDEKGKLHNTKAYIWYKGPGDEFSLEVGAAESRRAYVDISVDVDDLSSDFKLTVNIPTSDGTESSFTYLVTEERRLQLEEEKNAAIAPIDEALQGAWVYEDTTITFADGRFTYDYIRVSDGEREVNEGDYKIGPATITLAYDSGADPEIDYTFEDGVLSLFGEKGIPPVQFNYIKQE